MLANDGTLASRRRFLGRYLGGAAALVPMLGAGSMASQLLAQPSPQPATPPPLPDRADNSHRFPPVKDQGSRNTCAAFVVAALAEAALHRDSGRRVVLSEEYLIHSVMSRVPARQVPPYSEVMTYGVVIEAARIAGYALEQDWPYRPQLFANGKPCNAPGQVGAECPETTPGPVAIAPASSCDMPPAPPAWVDESAARLKVNGFAFANIYGSGWDAPAGTARRTEDLKRLIAINQGGIIAAIKQVNCNEGWADDGTVTVPKSLIGKPTAELDEMPNHFVVLTGYDVARQEFHFRNCWGKSWGREGYGTISFATIDTPIVGNGFVFVRRGTAV